MSRRTDSAAAALACYARLSGSDNLTDLLADLMHLADAGGTHEGFYEALDRAEDHYRAEVRS